jgi:XrtN system VIT domain protein
MTPQLLTGNKALREQKRKPQQEMTTIYAGWAMLAFSVLLYTWQETKASNNEDYAINLFFIHYFLALAYSGYLLYNGALGIRRSWHREHINKTTALLALFLVSAFALNRIIMVFHDFTPWLCVYLVSTCVSILSLHVYQALPKWVNRIQYALLGAGIVLFSYLTISLAGVYPFGFLGTLALGIGAHAFVPFFLLIAFISVAYHQRVATKASMHWITGGALAIGIFVTAFVVEWNTRVTRLEKLANDSVLFPEGQLPTWVSIAENISDDWITERILKSDLVYHTTPALFADWFSLNGPSLWDVAKEHDPLVLIANHLTRAKLPEEDRIKILKALSNKRHQAEERLWSGEHLTTSYIVTDVDIYSGLRIAYTEKYISIRNNELVRGRWTDNEEAIYTFQLPEGSVVSALSLWVNGVEEKGILTSKGKASTAYNTIVGVEMRDPSVVHWQEGNTVTVRVFPCTNKEERRFKIGVTSPLPTEGGKVVYRNLTFDGPDPSDAKETIRIRIRGDQDVTMPKGFKQDDNGDYIAEQSFDPDLDFSFPAKPLITNGFTFSGNTYSVTEHTPAFETKRFENLYLDLNHTWSKDELSSVRISADQYNVFVYRQGQFVRLTPVNWDKVTNELRDRNFSLFPFYLLTDIDNSLVITKGDPFTPRLSDFHDSPFAKGMADFVTNGKKANVFCFEDGGSTYINSLREFRALQFFSGDIEELAGILGKNRFVKSPEDENTVVINDAALAIKKSASSGTQGAHNRAPDHIARLFIYNDIMRKIGADYFRGELNDDLVAEAAKGYVVTPVSSLIVLESQQDYDRFEISDREDSLFNASRDSAGSVPEPHEWALIILFILFVIYVKVRN